MKLESGPPPNPFWLILLFLLNTLAVCLHQYIQIFKVFKEYDYFFLQKFYFQNQEIFTLLILIFSMGALIPFWKHLKNSHDPYPGEFSGLCSLFLALPFLVEWGGGELDWWGIFREIPFFFLHAGLIYWLLVPSSKAPEIILNRGRIPQKPLLAFFLMLTLGYFLADGVIIYRINLIFHPGYLLICALCEASIHLFLFLLLETIFQWASQKYHQIKNPFFTTLSTFFTCSCGYLIVMFIFKSLVTIDLLTMGLTRLSHYPYFIFALVPMTLFREFLREGGLVSFFQSTRFKKYSRTTAFWCLAFLVSLFFIPPGAEWGMMIHKTGSLIFLGIFWFFLISLSLFFPFKNQGGIRIGSVLPVLGMVFLLTRTVPEVRFLFFEILWTPHLFMDPIDKWLPINESHPELSKRFFEIIKPPSSNIRIYPPPGEGKNEFHHLWILIDAMRPLKLKKEKFPFFTGISGNWVHFENHRSNCNATYSSYFNLATGYFPTESYFNQDFPNLLRRRNVFQAWLRMEKFDEVHLPINETGVNIAPDYPTPLFLRGEHPLGAKGGVQSTPTNAGHHILERVEQVFRQNRDKKKFVFAYITDLHAIRERNPFGEDFGKDDYSIYLNNLSALDRLLGKTFKKFEEWGLNDKLVVHILSDHGEEFFEHNHNVHGFYLFEESLRAVWFLKHPHLKSQKITYPTTTLDILSTHLDLSGFTISPPLLGVSMVPAFKGKTLPERDLLFFQSAFSTQNGILFHDRFKLIFDFDRKFYYYFDLLTDPLEKNPLFPNGKGPYSAVLKSLLKFPVSEQENLKR